MNSKSILMKLMNSVCEDSPVIVINTCLHVLLKLINYNEIINLFL
jgi:hypothetical protein